MGTDDELSGLPWGSFSLKHVVSKGNAMEHESRRESRSYEDRSIHEARGSAYGGRRSYYGTDSTYYGEGDPIYYDYGSGSGSGPGSSSY